MKKLVSVVIAGFLLIVSAGCSSGVIMQSGFQPGVAASVSDVSQWGPELKAISDKTNIYFASKNDNEYVTFCFTTTNNAEIMKILRMGFTVTLEPKNSKTCKIQFPVRQQMQPMPDENRPEGMNKNPEERIAELISRQTEYSILDEKDNLISSLNTSGMGEVKPSLSYSKGQLTYLLRLPLSKKIDPILSCVLVPGEEIKINAATGQFKRPEGGMPGGGEGHRPGMGGGAGSGKRPGGGMGGNSGGMSPDARRQMFEPISLDFKVMLAKP